MKRVFVFSLIGLSVPFLVWAQVAPPNALTASRIREILTDIANFLIAVGIVGAVITIVTAGIIYFFHGFSANAVTKAKGVFKNALIGTLLVLGVGVIINTVGVIITGEFFGTVGPPGGISGGQIGDDCKSDDDCGDGLMCSQTQDKKVSICRRTGGGEVGEPCIDKDDCASGLACDTGTISTSGQGKKVSKVGTCKEPKPVPTLKP